MVYYELSKRVLPYALRIYRYRANTELRLGAGQVEQVVRQLERHAVVAADFERRVHRRRVARRQHCRLHSHASHSTQSAIHEYTILYSVLYDEQSKRSDLIHILSVDQFTALILPILQY